MQQSRFELKYHLTEDQALRVRNFAQCHIGLDEFSVGKKNFSYPVHSLYLDSDELKTYWATINGDKNRFKLRLRYYDSDPASPVFFEIKRRMDSTIHKQRAGVRSADVARLLGGGFVEEKQLVSSSPKQLDALQRFCLFTQQLHAKPRVHVAYEREAYVSDDDKFRLTLDRQIRAEANLKGILKTEMHEPRPVFDGEVILELKFTDRFPNWYRDLVEMFHLMQCGAAKYAEGIQALGSRAVGSRVPVVDEEAPRLRPVNGHEYQPGGFRRSPVPNRMDDED